MSFAIAPQIVTAAAENLAGIASTLGEATTAAAGPTTTVAAAAADDVSTAISRLFGVYGRQFQALGAQAAAFHNEFVGLLRGGAAAYLSTEMANAQQAGAGAAASTPILGGLGPILGGGTGGGILGGLGPTPGGGSLGPILNRVGQQIDAALTASFDGYEATLLPGLFAAGTTASAAGDPWRALFANTSANLQTIYDTWAAHPFPVLHQIISNQTGYANTVATAFTTTLQNFPTTLANVPTNVELSIQGTSTFVPAMQSFINQQTGYGQAIGAALPPFGADLQKSFPAFESDLGMAGQALMTGDFHGAVRDIPRAVLRLFLSGVDISNLSTREGGRPGRRPGSPQLTPVRGGAELRQPLAAGLDPGTDRAELRQWDKHVRAPVGLCAYRSTDRRTGRARNRRNGVWGGTADRQRRRGGRRTGRYARLRVERVPQWRNYRRSDDSGDRDSRSPRDTPAPPRYQPRSQQPGRSPSALRWDSYPAATDSGDSRKSPPGLSPSHSSNSASVERNTAVCFRSC